MSELTDDVRRLLSEDIEGYEQLEALLLLFGEADGWTRDRVGERLGIDADLASTSLAQLVDRGLVARGADGSYRFSPRDDQLAAAVAKLAAAYGDERRLHVMKAMNENAMQRLRHGAARLFADSFVLRKGKNDG
jgi:hypothetical protein